MYARRFIWHLNTYFIASDTIIVLMDEIRFTSLIKYLMMVLNTRSKPFIQNWSCLRLLEVFPFWKKKKYFATSCLRPILFVVWRLTNRCCNYLNTCKTIYTVIMATWSYYLPNVMILRNGIILYQIVVVFMLKLQTLNMRIVIPYKCSVKTICIC